MKQKSGPDKAPAERVLKDIRRQTRRQYSAEEKIRIVLEGLRGEENISELCRREGIAASMYYGWSKEFLEAGKRRLAGDTARAATSGEVKDLRREATALKEVVADLTLENRLLKKSMSGDGRVGERNVAEVNRIMTDYFHARDALEPVSRGDLISRLRDGLVTVLDVRPEDEFALGHLPGALNIPFAELEHRLKELPKSREVIAYCRGPYCVLSFEAVAALRAKGYRVRRLEDG